jgi:hypothetical protein
MKRSYIRSFSIDADTGEAFREAQARMRMSGSEIVNRLLMEWLLGGKQHSIMPRSPVLPNALPPTLLQRAKETVAREQQLKRQP